MKRTTLSLQLLFLPILLLCFAGASLAAGITLAWDANQEAQVAGYRVYYQTNSATVPLVGSTALEGPSPIEVGNVQTFTLNGLDESQIHYFAVTAYDEKGVESTLSEIVASSWVPAARTPQQDSLVAPNRAVFQWTAPPTDARVTSYRLYYSTNSGQLETAVSSGLAQAIGGSALAASAAMLGLGLGRSGRRRNWLAMAMLFALTGVYGCGGGGGGGDSSPVPVPSETATPHIESKPLSDVNIVTGLVDTYHTVSDLQPSTTYYWKVVAIDERGQEFEGATYRFTTEAF